MGSARRPCMIQFYLHAFPEVGVSIPILIRFLVLELEPFMIVRPSKYCHILVFGNLVFPNTV